MSLWRGGPALSSTSIRHIALVMGGDEEWIATHGADFEATVKHSVEAVNRVVDSVRCLELSYLSLFASSPTFTSALESFCSMASGRWSDLGIEPRIIGDLNCASTSYTNPSPLIAGRTEGKDSTVVIFADQLRAREHIVAAVRNLANTSVTRTPASLDIAPETLQGLMLGDDVPDIDVVVATGGGYPYLGDLPLLHIAYSEFVVSNTLWPDFGDAALKNVIKGYSSRNRRFGGITGNTS